MKLTIVCLLALLAFTMADQKTDHWAVIVAGSNGFWNYRHQADVCHAYHIMKDNGIPEDQIILLSYDDVASSSQNPFPGQLFNKPDGEDVYAGCNIDYKGKDVTPENFMNILKGKGDGKVLKSDSNSKVFINFADHGAPGLIAFPTKQLYAKDFHETLLYMHENKMYGEMTVYIEACESGSMFEGILEDDLNIYATTAANPHESSWGYYCGSDAVVQGKNIGSCLGDLYSIAWMEDSDAKDLCDETLSSQFDIVKERTTKSEVMKFGTFDFMDEFVGNFQGTCSAKNPIASFFKGIKKEPTYEEFHAIDSRDIKMHYLHDKYVRTYADEDAAALMAEVKNRQSIEERFSRLRASTGINAEGPVTITDWDCYKTVVSQYEDKCGLDEYDLKYFGHFVRLCEEDFDLATIDGLFAEMC
uniref:legumain n=1 Tax=Euplotes crassus TaxID=5936 RepID=A0A7S3KA71_EUPCR|mmetsp:Transcript_14046/g.14040  ORF Transcript_14046/g.14040 Transcript_14046/m.14040 type:complete len:416 (+) Transcript_14046:25-1272(+)